MTEPSAPGICKDCPNDVAICDGGAEIYPLPGYWRSSNVSDNFMQCPNVNSCLGRNYPENNLLGACSQGYRGIMCSDCMSGYSKSANTGKCSKCPSRLSNSLIICGLVCLATIVVVVIVRSNLKGASNEKNYLPVFIRILLNHL